MVAWKSTGGTSAGGTMVVREEIQDEGRRSRRCCSTVPTFFRATRAAGLALLTQCEEESRQNVRTRGVFRAPRRAEHAGMTPTPGLERLVGFEGGGRTSGAATPSSHRMMQSRKRTWSAPEELYRRLSGGAGSAKTNLVGRGRRRRFGFIVPLEPSKMGPGFPDGRTETKLVVTER